VRQQRQVESAFLDEVVWIHVEDKPKSEHEEEKTTSKKTKTRKVNDNWRASIIPRK